MKFLLRGQTSKNYRRISAVLNIFLGYIPEPVLIVDETRIGYWITYSESIPKEALDVISMRYHDIVAV